MPATILHRDYETRSTLDLKKVGVWKYATHPTTDVWCCAYAVNDGPVRSGYRVIRSRRSSSRQHPMLNG